MAEVASLEDADRAAAAPRPRIGVILPATGWWPEVRDLAHFAEELGVESVWVPDGFSGHHLEAWTVLSALAASTERVEVGVYMLNASLRDLALLAKMTTTLERMAPSRIRILLGTGWDRSDYEALDTDFPAPDARVARTRRAVSVLTDRTHASVDVAGVTDEVLRVVAQEAHGWALSGEALDVFFERAGSLRDVCAETGRVFSDLRISCTMPCLDDPLDRIWDLHEHGMHEFRVALTGDPADRGRLEQMVRELRSRSR